MKNMKKRTLRSALLLTVAVLLLTCMTVMGIFADDPVKYPLDIYFTLTDAEGNSGLAMIRVELAEGEEIDLDAIIADHPGVAGLLAGLEPDDAGIAGLPEDGKMPAGGLVLNTEYAAEPFTVTWMVDGVAVTDTVKYGGIPKFPNGTPTKAPDAQYTYTFAGWDAEPVEAYGDVTYTALFTETLNEYTVTWNVDGVETSETYKYGETPVFKGTTDKAADAQYTYTFNGWNQEIAAVTGDVTYTAQYDTTVNEYDVTWIVEGVETTVKVPYGTVPTYDGTPVKAGNAQYSYTFDKWDTEPVAVVGNATYTAQFTETVNQYTVTWIVDGETVKTEALEYGQIPADFVPAKENTAEFTYTFNGWDQELTAVVGDVTYTGSFTATKNTYTVTWIVDGTETTETYTYGDMPSFKGSTAKPDADGYTYTFKGWNAELAVVTGNVTYTAQYDAVLNEVTITFKVDGQADVTVTVKVGETPAYPNGTPAKADDAQYTYTFNGWDKPLAAATEDTVYTAQFSTTTRKYYVHFYYGHNVVLPVLVEYGQAATAPTNTDKAPTEDTVFTFDGWDVDFSNITGPLKVYAKYTEAPRTYTVTFNYGDGKTETVTVEYGKGATAPTDTDKAATEEYTFTFKGWDVDFSKVTSDLTVNAQYDQTPVKEPETNEPETNEPETNEPETNEPETNEPETNKPETNEPETDPATTPETDPGETETEAPVTGGCGNTWIWIVLVIVVVGAGAAVVIILLRRKNSSDPEPTEPETAPVAEPEVEAEPETQPENEVETAPAAPLFIPVGDEVPEEEIPDEVETVDEVAADDVDDMMSDKVAVHFLVTSDEEGGAGKMGIINVGLISAAYQAGETVDLASLQEKGMIDGNVGRLKVLASGTLDKPLIIKADAFSVQAIKMITLTGGQAIELKGE